MAHVRRELGLRHGGHLALTALATLSGGGDYDDGGADGFGQKRALKTIRLLLEGCEVMHGRRGTLGGGM
jgi:hypothetical protein